MSKVVFDALLLLPVEPVVPISIHMGHIYSFNLNAILTHYKTEFDGNPMTGLVQLVMLKKQNSSIPLILISFEFINVTPRRLSNELTSSLISCLPADLCDPLFEIRGYLWTHTYAYVAIYTRIALLVLSCPQW